MPYCVHTKSKFALICSAEREMSISCKSTEELKSDILIGPKATLCKCLVFFIKCLQLSLLSHILCQNSNTESDGSYLQIN